MVANCWYSEMERFSHFSEFRFVFLFCIEINQLLPKLLNWTLISIYILLNRLQDFFYNPDFLFFFLSWCYPWKHGLEESPVEKLDTFPLLRCERDRCETSGSGEEM